MIDKLGLDGLGGASVRVEPDRGLLGRIDDLQAELAASQAREQQLREVLKKIQFGNTKFDRTGDSQDYCPECNGTAYTGHDSGCFVQKALALPQDDTALREWGANLLEEMAMEIDLGTHS